MASNPWLDNYVKSGASESYRGGGSSRMREASDSGMTGKKKKLKGNILTRNLDTAGGIGGGLAGAAAGAALGSVVPGLGTVVGGLAGGVLGAIGGGGAGKYASQKALGEETNWDDVRNAAAMSGVGELAGAGIGQLVMKGGAKVAPKIFSKMAGGEAKALKGARAGLTDTLEGRSTKAITKQMGSNLDPSDLQNSFDVQRLYDKSEVARHIGLYSHKARKKAAEFVTGTQGFANAIKNKILDNSGAVPILSGIRATSDEIATRNAIHGPQKKAFTAAVIAQVNKALGPGGAVGDMAVSASKAFKAVQALEKKAVSVRVKEPELSAAYREAAEHLGKIIDDHAGVNKAIAGFQVAPELAEQITARAVQQFGKGKGGRLAEYMIDEMNAAKTLKDWRGLESKFVTGGKAANKEAIGHIQKGAATLPEQALGAAVSPLGKLGLARMIGQAAAGMEAPIAGTVARATAKVGDFARGAGAGMAGLSPMMGGAGAMAGGVAQRGAGQATFGTASPVFAAGGDDDDDGADYDTEVQAEGEDQDYGTVEKLGSMDEVFGGEDGDGAAADEVDEETSGYGLENLKADIKRDPANMSDYMALYKMLNPEGDTKTKLSATQRRDLSQVRAGKAAMNQLSKMYRDAGGGKGRVGGVLASLTGKAGGMNDVNAYNELRDALLSKISRAAGETGVLTDQDIARIKKGMPKFTDNPEEFERKLAGFQELMDENEASIIDSLDY